MNLGHGDNAPSRRHRLGSMTMARLWLIGLIGLIIPWGTACGTDDPSTHGVDGGGRDGAVAEAGPRDAGQADASSSDAAAIDGSAPDGGGHGGGGGGGADAATSDAGSRDAAARDGGGLNDGGTGGGDGGGTDAGGADGDTCATAIALIAGSSLPGSTSGATDDYEPSGSGCPTGGRTSGADRAYALSPATTTTYRVQVTPTGSFDPMLYAVNTCGASGCLEGTILNGPGEPETITFTVAGGATAYVIVDGEFFSEGDYTIEVTTGP